MKSKLLALSVLPMLSVFPSIRSWRRIAAAIAMALIAATSFLPAPAVQAADRYRVEIINLESKLRADVMWASTSPYQGVFTWGNNASASQEFDLLDSGGGHFRIRARHSGQCLMLDWRQGSYTNGTKIIQYPYCSAGYRPAEWRVESRPTAIQCDGDVCSTDNLSFPVLVNRQTDDCLDAANPRGGPPPVQAPLQQWDCIRTADDWNAGNQLWSAGPWNAL